jgi:hypothetical protein
MLSKSNQEFRNWTSVACILIGPLFRRSNEVMYKGAMVSSVVHVELVWKRGGQLEALQAYVFFNHVTLSVKQVTVLRLLQRKASALSIRTTQRQTLVTLQNEWRCSEVMISRLALFRERNRSTGAMGKKSRVEVSQNTGLHSPPPLYCANQNVNITAPRNESFYHLYVM